MADFEIEERINKWLIENEGDPVDFESLSVETRDLIQDAFNAGESSD